MKPSQKKVWVAMAVGILLIFLVRNMWLSVERNLEFFGEKNVALVRTPSGTVIGFGDTKSPQAEILLRSVQPYFLDTSVLDLSLQSVGLELTGKDFFVQILSENIAQGVFGDQKIIFIGDDFTSGEATIVKSQRTKLDADFWVMTRNEIPKFLPPPQSGILHIGERSPSKKLKTFAHDKELPLISVRETGGFSLEFLGERWELHTRK